jgi:hypothetical protein
MVERCEMVAADLIRQIVSASTLLSSSDCLGAQELPLLVHGKFRECECDERIDQHCGRPSGPS